MSELANVLYTIAKEVETLDRFWYVVYICVDPDPQRCGIGSKLIQRAFQRAKANDLPLATCAEPASCDFYLLN
ncbi:hypothetical protein N7492_006638 [Penicillium capsulatum]|uniref:N-acetyltransferase domain-containing protein n=1 Tax=Penicillium capsulatum TaxID=69766 RepID=A0A9W9I0K2_9EURO|nr:hypothetical protein N7492_006638 [Penicillium capsulatum]KAJ6116473.1 hypothetical protein N7512_006198 [Penicillium capsulatum]